VIPTRGAGRTIYGKQQAGCLSTVIPEWEAEKEEGGGLPHFAQCIAANG